MPITFKDALAQTNPELPEEQRNASAQAIMSGVAANDAYWDSRGELEALRAQAEGHGVVQRGDEGEPARAPIGAAPGAAPAIEGTAVEEPAAGTPSPAETVPPPAATEPTPAPDNPVEAVAKLRQQLRDANLQPEA